MELHVTYDMRAPDFGANRNDLYDAMLDQVQWADELGFDAIGTGEHHCSDDGYNPSSLVLASAIAARTRVVEIRLSILVAPLYDLPKLAEDAAVAQIISRGRLVMGIGAGYRAQEFETFGRKLDDRWQAMGDTIEFLRLAWKGEEFEWQGRKCLITPTPEPFPPPIVLAGSSPAAARRAARIADGWFPPLEPRLWSPYREECIRLGKPDPGEYRQHAPIFLWVSEDPEKTWDVLMPHVLHQLDSYSRWTTEAMGRPAGPYAGGMTREKLKQSPAYRVLTPEQTLELVAGLGDHSVFYLNPLLSGIAPQESWKMLRLYEEQVHPHIRRVASAGS
ncbi:MAG: LLM class flavin-dependent oxidoreductase [Proteobacteria bacterium]|nr:LLM class flavin-dependent oxidoreductase [Pseudomonadota bacterium]